MNESCSFLRLIQLNGGSDVNFEKFSFCVLKDANLTLLIHDLCFLAQIYAALVVMYSNSWVVDLTLLSNASNG